MNNSVMMNNISEMIDRVIMNKRQKMNNDVMMNNINEVIDRVMINKR